MDAKVLKTCGIDADGEVVWSWRAKAGAKSCGRDRPRDDGGNRWFTGESAK